MPKSKKRRTARTKNKKDLRRAFAALSGPVPVPRPRHFKHDQVCPAEALIEEFGEENATWLQEEYGRPLTMAELQLEVCIRRDEFVLDDPFTGPATVTAEEISEVVDMTAMVILGLAGRQGVLTDEQAQEAAEIEAMDPIDHAAEGVDTVRAAFQSGGLFLNDRGMWDFAGEET